MLDHPPRVLVQDGRLLHKELRRCGLTKDDIYGLLREHGIVDLSQVHFVIFEQRGKISIIQHSDSPRSESQLLRDIAAQTQASD